MKRTHLGWLALLAALAVLGFLQASAQAQQSSGPSPEELEDLAKDFGIDPAQCEALQKQIDRVVSVYQSGMSDDEKVARLSELWAQTASSMQKSGANDPEVGSAVNQYLFLMQELMAMAQASPGGSDKSVTPAARNSLNKLKGLSQNYVKMMKVMCPKLTLPPVMNQ